MPNAYAALSQSHLDAKEWNPLELSGKSVPPLGGVAAARAGDSLFVFGGVREDVDGRGEFFDTARDKVGLSAGCFLAVE
jgi:hypothetical protein